MTLDDKIQIILEDYRKTRPPCPKHSRSFLAIYSLNRSLRYQEGRTNGRYKEVTGLSTADFISHLESKLKDGQSWSNYGTVWRIGWRVHPDAFPVTWKTRWEMVATVNESTNLIPEWITD